MMLLIFSILCTIAPSLLYTMEPYEATQMVAHIVSPAKHSYDFGFEISSDESSPKRQKVSDAILSPVSPARRPLALINRDSSSFSQSLKRNLFKSDDNQPAGCHKHIILLDGLHDQKLINFYDSSLGIENLLTGFAQAIKDGKLGRVVKYDLALLSLLKDMEENCATGAAELAKYAHKKKDAYLYEPPNNAEFTQIIKSCAKKKN
jgi:hypothetical protein